MLSVASKSIDVIMKAYYEEEVVNLLSEILNEGIEKCTS